LVLKHYEEKKKAMSSSEGRERRIGMGEKSEYLRKSSSPKGAGIRIVKGNKKFSVRDFSFERTVKKKVI